MVARILGTWGFEAKTAHSLQNGMRAVLTTGPYDAVICSQKLPDGTGPVFLKWLRDSVIPIPFILVSSALKPPPHLKSLSRFEMLRKPFEPEQLYALLQRLLPHHKSAGPLNDSAQTASSSDTPLSPTAGLSPS